MHEALPPFPFFLDAEITPIHSSSLLKALSRRLLRLGEQLLLGWDAELFPDVLELVEVLLVLRLVLDLGADSCPRVSFISQC